MNIKFYKNQEHLVLILTHALLTGSLNKVDALMCIKIVRICNEIYWFWRKMNDIEKLSGSL